VAKVSLENAHTAIIVNSVPVKRADKQIIDTGAEDGLVDPGDTADFDGNNPGVIMMAKAGLLTPVGAAATTWFNNLS
jgi:hypothetical protein